MTYEAYESSTQLGARVELYEFQYGITILRYTNQDDTYAYLGQEFLPTTITRPEIEESAELSRNNIKIRVPRDLPIADLFRVYPPSEEVTVKLYSIHRSDPDQQRLLDWDGRVLNATWYGSNAELHCENILTSFRRKGLRRPYQTMCPHDLYSQGPGLCNADKPGHKVVATLTALDGPFLTSATFDALEDGYFDGGILEWEEIADIWHYRRIKSHVGDQIELAQPIIQLVNGASVDAYPGCAHDMSTRGCFRFDNIKNYGGTLVAKKNPFGSSGIG